MRLLLGSREFFVADLWTVTLLSGPVLRYNSGDQDIRANGLLYSSGGQVGPYWDRTSNKAKSHWTVGTSTDTMTVDIIPFNATILGDPMLQAIHDGIFDGAEVMLERAFMPTYGDTRVGVIRTFIGEIAPVDSGRSLITLNINSPMDKLNLQFPRNLSQSACVNNLGDSTCTVNLASYTASCVVAAASTKNAVEANFVSGSAPADKFVYGKMTFTSGVLDGFSMSVMSSNIGGSSDLELMTNGPLPEPPSVGDTFTLTYGCDKSYNGSNGCPKFNNLLHFRAFPFVPQPSVAV